jgi:hypothetical protein
MYGLLVDPLRYLGLSDAELCLFYAIIIFSASQSSPLNQFNKLIK